MSIRRRPVPPETVSQDRWLVSYADFITLLFALFVVMFASSQADSAKLEAVSRAVTKAFNGAAQHGYKDSRDELRRSFETLSEALAKEIASGEITIAMLPRGLVISLQESAFFPSGSDTLLALAVPSMDKIAAVITKLPNRISLEGHTDSIPISNTRFRSNWELSSARGISVMQWFHNRHGPPQAKFAVVAYADTLPKASNATEEGRALNRRVEVIILSEDNFRKTPRSDKSGIQTAPISKGDPIE